MKPIRFFVTSLQKEKQIMAAINRMDSDDGSVRPKDVTFNEASTKLVTGAGEVSQKVEIVPVSQLQKVAKIVSCGWFSVQQRQRQH